MTEPDLHDDVVEIASQVADGAPIDWPSASDSAAEESRGAIEQLRTIARIAQLHRQFQAGARSHSPADAHEAPADGVPWGPLLVFEKLGSGAFGEVFRAWDPSLEREVALKLLRGNPGSAGDAVVQEGQRLARVSHTNVMSVYGAQRVGSRVGIWGELLRGKTLAALIAGDGPLSADETALAGESICRALSAVHRVGMLHRDVKAQNVFREKGGRLVLMDLGLGRELDAVAKPGELAGTPLYLAPELFKRGSASVQSDIYSLGVLLFFLATGAFPVTGESLEEVARAHRDGRRARLQDLRPEFPRQVVQVVERALDPDPAKRYQSAGAMQAALARAAHGDAAQPGIDGGKVALVPVVLACAAVALIVAAVMWAVWRPAPPVSPAPARFAIVPPPAQSLDIQDNDRNIAISRDGRHIVYRSGGTSTGGPLMLRPIDRLDAQPLAGITNGRGPFFSADGRSVGFFDRQELKRIPLTGEPAATVCRFAEFPRGASWGDDDTIVFATNDESTGLLRVPAKGGTPVPFTTPDPSRHEKDHLFPSVLPDNRGVLFTIESRGQEPVMQVAVFDNRTKQHRPLIPNASQAEYVPPPKGSVDPGYLLYAAGEGLHIVRFDLEGLRPVGPSAQVVPHLRIAENGAANYAIAGTGTLAYLEKEAPRLLVWVNREGIEERIDAPERAYSVPRISPNGRQIVVEVRAQDQDLWILDFDRRRFDRLTSDAGLDRSPVWSLDGLRVLFASNRKGQFHVYVQNTDGTGSAEQITTAINAHPTSITSDGSILSNQFGKGQGRILRLKAPAEVVSLIDDEVEELGGQVSPDGHSIVYQSNESGRFEVYVSPYPNVRGGRWPVSTEGGTNPVWARSGTEIFFLDAATVMTAVPVTAAPGRVVPGVAKKLFDARMYRSDGLRGYDISPDGSRFLMIKENPTVRSSVIAPAIFVVMNWFEEVRSRLGRVQ